HACYGITASKIGRRRWRPSNFAARLPNASALAHSTTRMSNASTLSAAIRRRRIGTASTRLRANSFLRPVHSRNTVRAVEPKQSYQPRPSPILVDELDADAFQKLV